MSTLFDEIERQTRFLTPHEKASLARILIEELDSNIDPAVESIWVEEAKRRYEAYRNGELNSLAGD
jgi:hypothetical protein